MISIIPRIRAKETSRTSGIHSAGAASVCRIRTEPKNIGTISVHATCHRNGTTITEATVATLTRYQIHGCVVGSDGWPAVAAGHRASATT